MPNLKMKQIGAAVAVPVSDTVVVSCVAVGPFEAELVEEGTLLATTCKDGDCREDGNWRRPYTLRQESTTPRPSAPSSRLAPA